MVKSPVTLIDSGFSVYNLPARHPAKIYPLSGVALRVIFTPVVTVVSEGIPSTAPFPSVRTDIRAGFSLFSGGSLTQPVTDNSMAAIINTIRISSLFFITRIVTAPQIS